MVTENDLNVAKGIIYKCNKLSKPKQNKLKEDDAQEYHNQNTEKQK